MTRWGIESTVTINGQTVTKVYKAAYFRLNEAYARPPEAHWYERRVVPMMPRLITHSRDSLTLAYAGEPLNAETRYPGLAEWAERTLAALKSAGVHHRDIHAKNVLHKDGVYMLIDWTWANPDPNAPAATPRPRDEVALGNIARLGT